MQNIYHKNVEECIIDGINIAVSSVGIDIYYCIRGFDAACKEKYLFKTKRTAQIYCDNFNKKKNKIKP